MEPRLNEASQYGVTIQPTASAPAWRAVRVRRLSPEANAGRNNIFVKVLTATGERDRDPSLRIGWTWEGRRLDEQAPLVPLSKNDNETGHGDIPMTTMNQRISVWIVGGGIPSDVVAGMHTNHPDEWPGSTRGHFSYEVIFQRAQGVAVEPDLPVDGDSLAELRMVIAAMQKQLDEMRAILQRWDGE